MNNWILICAAFSGVPIAVVLILLRKNKAFANIFHSFGKTEHIIIAGLVLGGVLLIISAVLAILEFENAAFAMSVMQGICYSGVNEK